MADKRIHVWVTTFADRPHLVLQWTDPDTGRKRSKTAGTADPQAAEGQRIDLESDLNNHRHAEASKMTWPRFRELFEEEYVAAKRPNTRTNFARALDLFEEICKPARLANVDGRTLSRFAAGLRKLPGRAKDSTGMMASTIRVRLQFLQIAFSWAKAQKLIPEALAFPEIKVPDKSPQPVPTETVEKLLGKADPHMRVFLLCGWLAGLRLTEALALHWSEAPEPYVDFARRRIVLPAEYVKGVRDQWVPLDPVLQEALEALPRHGKRVFRFVGQTGKPLAATRVSHLVVNAARRAGVRLTMKSLRRGFGCRYAGRVPAQVLQKLMRHANIATTMKYYANVDDAVMEAVVGKTQAQPLGNNSGNTAPKGREEPVSGN